MPIMAASGVLPTPLASRAALTLVASDATQIGCLSPFSLAAFSSQACFAPTEP